jgi:hypothetical protein
LTIIALRQREVSDIEQTGFDVSTAAHLIDNPSCRENAVTVLAVRAN